MIFETHITNKGLVYIKKLNKKYFKSSSNVKLSRCYEQTFYRKKAQMTSKDMKIYSTSGKCKLKP